MLELAILTMHNRNRVGLKCIFLAASCLCQAPRSSPFDIGMFVQQYRLELQLADGRIVVMYAVHSVHNVCEVVHLKIG